MVELDTSDPVRRAKLLVAAFALSAAGVGAALGWLSRPLRWPSVRGEVLESALLSLEGVEGPFVMYAYEVDGRRHQGTRLTQFCEPGRYELDRTHLPWSARAFVARHPVGAPIEVRYDPGDPGQAVVWWTLVTPGVVLALVLVALLGAAALVSLLRVLGGAQHARARGGARRTSRGASRAA